MIPTGVPKTSHISDTTNHLAIGTKSISSSNDPEFGNQKASSHADLSDPTRFKEVVPIRDEQIKSKIHLTYRLHYFKEIFLARIMDYSTFEISSTRCSSSTKSRSSNTYTVGTTSCATCLGSLIWEPTHYQPIHPPPSSALPYRHRCSSARWPNIPKPRPRISFFRSLAERGILEVIEFGLPKENLTNRNTDPSAAEEGSTEPPKTDEVREKEAMTKSAVCEILITIIYYDPSRRCSIWAELGLGNPSTNMALADSNGQLKRDEDPDNERSFSSSMTIASMSARPFLQLLELIHNAPEINLRSTSVPDDQESVSITPLEAATFTHLCELICFIVVQHSFRSQVFHPLDQSPEQNRQFIENHRAQNDELPLAYKQDDPSRRETKDSRG
ncbi:uncharacterized protein PGTG_15272 [Puccinia graminis f. sp. tritici CRL 75-36-700-3]|uniref:Serine/threonine-protein phosphatase 4 regulatory subunit 3-like central domain-containing protein n=1 Tax=Puccinia graminis f. sp. tritici (strain CRL 75-36-700-3 / race SCCL) TaxID=418459 RepID=E3KYN4_PUCGT|nr:uncharacterized protein PGTG_15272 [Puccinia graminis f. sp. tritici CRL 75-36-700-3]EFP89430.2 hypothetical protein PGTG_15272 [Puccinia graminis f. sp. tritici CRL 75-36-700-3]